MMARTFLPPGFRFHPADVGLVMYHLKRKVIGKNVTFEVISELNIYKYSPWDLPGINFFWSVLVAGMSSSKTYRSSQDERAQ
ncbi:hypothetical protein RHGRI_003288 [Rhododendron griersonianum]|uniref:NAC domain-containing protein n=1 Tax=Rhododendron griersonianum TaxID=479676 RepID=A0AAV6L4Z6_9ERIC|nr:hypothetical protein RHGRI_003288 [Rhododendron griersonianum]